MVEIERDAATLPRPGEAVRTRRAVAKYVPHAGLVQVAAGTVMAVRDTFPWGVLCSWTCDDWATESTFDPADIEPIPGPRAPPDAPG